MCSHEAQQSPLLWLGLEQQLEVLRAETPSGHLPGVRRWEEYFGPGATSVASLWGCALDTSAAWVCAMLICANENIQKVSLHGKSLKRNSYFKCIPMGTLVLNYARRSGTNEFY